MIKKNFIGVYSSKFPFKKAQIVQAVILNNNNYDFNVWKLNFSYG